MAKIIINGEEARKKIYEGVEKLAKVVEVLEHLNIRWELVDFK